jgi:uncharacterized protein YecT (DUF1311 family)
MTRQFAFLAAAILCSALPGGAAAEEPFRNFNCKNAKVQMELNYCADQDFKSADRKLNALYRKLLDGDDPKEKALLKVAERDWIAYRDSECALETAGSEGGSIAPMEYSVCLTEKTGARIKELQRQGD